jgi:transcriptional regulator with GAF, ATPase, and Fis domain
VRQFTSQEVLDIHADGSARGRPASTFVQAQRNVTIDALKAASGQISGKRGAAEVLGLERTTLQHKIRRLGSAKAHYWH